MLLAGLFFALMNVCVKLVSHLPTMEVVLFRSALSLLFTYILLRRSAMVVLFTVYRWRISIERI